MSDGSTTTAMEAIEGTDLTGTVAIVTGATGGIGLETARALLSAGATVYLANRPSEKSDRSLADLTADADAERVQTVDLDLTSLDSVNSAADDLLSRIERLDLVVNNAGVMATPFERTADGFELQIGVNHLGHFAFTGRLLPRLLDSNAARIVNLSSSAHHFGGVDLDDLNYESREYAPWRAYGQSKTANILFTSELRRRYGDQGLTAYAVHPGFVETDLFRYLDPEEIEAMDARAARNEIPAKKTPQQGAATSITVAVGDPVDFSDAVYFEDCAPSASLASHADDADTACGLWELSERLVGSSLPS